MIFCPIVKNWTKNSILPQCVEVDLEAVEAVLRPLAASFVHDNKICKDRKCQLFLEPRNLDWHSQQNLHLNKCPVSFCHVVLVVLVFVWLWIRGLDRILTARWRGSCQSSRVGEEHILYYWLQHLKKQKKKFWVSQQVWSFNKNVPIFHPE